MFASTNYAGLIALVACLALSSTHIAAAQTEDEDLGAVLSSQKNLSTFYGLIKEYPDVLLKLPSQDGMTIVAPSNAAFENIPGTSLNGIWDPKNASIAVPILEYHLLKGIVNTEDLAPGPSIFAATLLTSPAWTNVSTGQNVVLARQPGDVVVFTSAQGSRTTRTRGDIAFAGGLIQVIDNLLIPPTPLSETLPAFGLDAFLGVLHASDLLSALQGDEDLTIFAPRDEAFRRVGASLDALGADELRDLVRYHVVRGRVAASATLTNGTRLAAAEGGDVSVRRAGNNLFVNSAQVVQPDIPIANGVVHVIDNVLNPRAAAAVPDPDSVSQAPVWSAGGDDEGTPFTSAIPCSEDCPATTTAASSEGTGRSTARLTTTYGVSGPTASPDAAGREFEAGTGLRAAAGFAVVAMLGL
ncbi:hypothetical protein BN1723_012009 [Verticillium longisporum]|uniref:FAS1 domain-containing protein n=1 Tax=Verticillium longisporum TaxID=100787 RepID=A0A0G4LIM9_VERLO|nr:hypothetical protein BN1723_012009 [Verticillium longisporum]CRK21887.1 hypothetical protein BN1708_003481 [Verticillium longisporum]